MRHSQFLVAAAISLWFSALAHAQLPSAKLFTIFPPGGQQGTSIEVTVSGADLDELTNLRFSTPGIHSRPKLDAAGKSVPNVFVVDVNKDMSPGAYEVRAVGRFGVTNPRTFVVDREPQPTAKPGNVTREAAAVFPIESGAYSVAPANAPQFYRIDLKASQHAFIDVDSIAIDSKYEPVLVLYDSLGRELARDGQNGSIDIKPPADGSYLIEIHDVLYRGGPEFFYRLRATAKPRVDFSLPQALGDEMTEVVSVGREPSPRVNFKFLDSEDDASALRARWFVPSTAAMVDGRQRYTLGGIVNPMFVARSFAPLVAEAADNNDPAKAQKLSPPFELYGQFFPRSDQDWITFDAKKGEAYWIEVVSNRLLGFTDPMVVVQRVTRDAQGKEQAVDVKEAFEPENIPAMPREFNAADRDPAFRFQVPEDGTYRLLVRDLFNEGADDPKRTYRLCVSPAASREDFRLVAWPAPPQSLVPPPVAGTPVATLTWGSNIRPAGTMSISVLAFRTGGFAGDITLTAEGLPNGVTCPPVVMNGGTNSATLILIADEKATPFIGPIRIIGSTSPTVWRVARSGACVWTVPNPDAEPIRSRLAQEFVIAVASGEVEPISIALAETKTWEDSVVGRIEIPLKITRRGAYAGAVKLKPAGASPKILAMPEFEIAAGATDGKLTLEIGALELPPGNHSLYLQATSTGFYDRYPAQFAAAQATKAAADKVTPELAAAVQKATEALQAAKLVANNAANIAAAEKALADASEKLKQNEAAKVAVAEQIKALTPKDTLAYAYSPPINVKITPAPITLVPTAPASLKPGAKIDVPVTIARLYGFVDPVDLTVAIPQGITGFSVTNIAIAANATQAAVSIQAAADAKPGQYTFVLAASLKQNSRPVKVEQPIQITVTAP